MLRWKHWSSQVRASYQALHPPEALGNRIHSTGILRLLELESYAVCIKRSSTQVSPASRGALCAGVLPTWSRQQYESDYRQVLQQELPYFKQAGACGNCGSTGAQLMTCVALLAVA
jgi:hypothetical protein